MPVLLSPWSLRYENYTARTFNQTKCLACTLSPAHAHGLTNCSAHFKELYCAPPEFPVNNYTCVWDF